MITAKTAKNKLLNWLVPSISEAEFVFFVSLYFCGITAWGWTHWEAVTTFFNFNGPSDDVQVQLGIAAIIGVFTLSLILLAVKAIKSKRTIKFSDRRQYVTLPPVFLTFIWTFNGLAQASGTIQPQPLLITIGTTIITVRYLTLVVLLRIWSQDTEFETYLSNRLVNYQLTKRETFGVIALGLIGGVSLLLFDNWLAWMIILYGIGQEMIWTYRESRDR